RTAVTAHGPFAECQNSPVQAPGPLARTTARPGGCESRRPAAPSPARRAPPVVERSPGPERRLRSVAPGRLQPPAGHTAPPPSGRSGEVEFGGAEAVPTARAWSIQIGGRMAADEMSRPTHLRIAVQSGKRSGSTVRDVAARRSREDLYLP